MAEPLEGARRRGAYAVAVVVAALTIVDLSKVNVALPAIETALGPAPAALQLVVAGYVLTFGLALVPAGRLGDQRGRRPLFIVGLILSAIASAVSGAAPDATVLLVARLVQGVAAGIQMPQVIGLIQSLYSGAARARAFGWFGALIGTSVSLGPTLGGLAIALGGPVDGWRWVFWLNVPLALAALVGVLVLVPRREAERVRGGLDPVGLLLCGVAALALMWPFLFTTGSADDPPVRWLLLVVSAVAVAGLVAWERRYERSGRTPLVPLALFGFPSFRHSVLVSLAYFAAGPPLFLVTALFLQGTGLTPLQAGLVTVGFAVTSALASAIGGRFPSRARVLVVCGCVILLGAVLLLALLALTAPRPWITPGFVALLTLAGVGGGFTVAANQSVMLIDVPLDHGGVAGSVGQLAQRIGTAIGSAVALSLFQATLAHGAHREAFGTAALAIGGFLILAVLFALLDLRRRRRAGAERQPFPGGRRLRS
ncbi:MFS transporter [Microbacterium rhizophilus]|uniref:MFS transporter n=1 Tax=Microbacterium rhizophilus TaxID=3138934 RepID=UPI0031EEECE3